MSLKLPTALASITLSLGLLLAVGTAETSKSASIPAKASASAPAKAASAAPAPAASAAPAGDSATAQTIVYLAGSGSRYHVKGCRYLKNKGKSITIGDAMKQGFAPCNVCKAPKIKR